MEKMKYVPEDIMASIFYYLYLESPQSPFFTGNLRKIHEVIFELRKDYPILKAFPFAVNEVSPFSRLLEDVLHTLELSRVIRMENPDFTRFMVKKEAIECLEKSIIPLFNADEIKQLQEITKKFREKCI